jgi:hypothetical protein
MIWALAVAGLATIGVAVTTTSVVFLQRRETAEAKRELEEYKLTVEAKVADAKTEGIEAGRTAGNALVRAAGLEKQAEQLRRDTADANARALEAKLELAKFKLDRTLSDDQKSRIIGKLKAFAGQQYVLSVSTDQEALRFVRISLGPVFNSAGWVKLPPKGTVSIPEIDAAINVAGEPGVRMQIAQIRRDDPELNKRIFAVAAALGAEGIDATPAMTPDMDDTPAVIQIRIGSKPK